MDAGRSAQDSPGEPLLPVPAHAEYQRKDQRRTIRTMQLMETFASAFFRSFGITQPTDRARRGAAWFLLGMLLLVGLGLAGMGYLLFRVM